MGVRLLIRRLLVGLLLVFFLGTSFGGCVPSPSTIPPSVEEILPAKGGQVKYVAKPSKEVAKLLFSEQANWSKYVGKWVVWRGRVHEVLPKLKPSRIVFLDEFKNKYGWSEKYGVEVNFHSQWREKLKKVSVGEVIYYRAKLVQQELAFFGLHGSVQYNVSEFLVLKEGEIIEKDSIPAKLIDLVHASYEGLEKIVEEAEDIATVRNYFERRLEDTNAKWIAIRAALKLINVRIPAETWLEEISLPKKRERKSFYKSRIESHLQSALTSLHFATPSHERLYLEEIKRKLEANKEKISEIEKAKKPLVTAWKRERESATLGISDLLGALSGQLNKFIGLGLIVKDALEEYGKLEPYQQFVSVSNTLLGIIDTYMTQIYNNTVEATDSVIKALNQY